MKQTFFTTAALILSVFVGAQITQAIGSLTPSGTAGDDTQYTLNDIYAKLTTGNNATLGTGTMTVPGSVSASFRTLTEVYNALPEWVTLSNATTTVAEGFYEATTLTAVDADLTAANIASGVTIFGVLGTNGGGGGGNLEWSTNRGANTHAAAISACLALVEGGHSDWYLPTIEDFASITDYALFDSATAVSGFISSTQYWSSTTLASDNTYAWFWNSYGGDIISDVLGASYETRCVRAA